MAGSCAEPSIPVEPVSALGIGFSLVRISVGSSQEEVQTEKDESQKVQARTLDGNTAPHCEQVFVTGKFCAADASTPVRREHSEVNTQRKCQTDKEERLLRI
jgi:hypothetical protein